MRDGQAIHREVARRQIEQAFQRYESSRRATGDAFVFYRKTVAEVGLAALGLREGATITARGKHWRVIGAGHGNTGTVYPVAVLLKKDGTAGVQRFEGSADWELVPESEPEATALAQDGTGG